MGEKLICPTCGSNYNISNGYVDQGPSLRNLSSFHTQTREGQVQVTVPEHVPAFARKKFLKRSKLDPRVFVIVGDSETALSAVDALRTTFTGEIIVLPVSAFGQFENLDVFRRKMNKLSKNEVFLLDQDFLDRANCTVLKT